MAGDAGLSLWLVVLGPRSLVVLGPCCQLQVVLLGPCHFSWVEGLGTGCIVHGWWWCALIVPFVNGGGAPSSVFLRHGPRHCRGGPVVARGRGWWVIHVCGCSIHCHPMLASCVVSMCCHRVSLIVIVCPRHVVVPCPPHHCPMMLLLPCPCCDMSFDCHIAVGDMAPVLKR